MMKRLLLVAFATLLLACVRVPDNVVPVNDFSLERYLGTWYEIARMDHTFERGLTKVTAEYSMREDGGVRVLNRGYAARDEAWKQAEGKAYFVDQPNHAHLKVSFFGPFYASYVVFDLDRENYQWAMISGPDTSYLWILSRTPTLDPAIKLRLIARAAHAGFDTSKLIHLDMP